MIGFGMCLLILALLVPELAVLWSVGTLSLIAGAVLHAAGALRRTGTGGRHPT